VRAGREILGVIDEPPPSFQGELGSYYSVPPHGPNVRAAEWNGLLSGLIGFGPGWNPGAKATRAEAAQIMWNLLLLVGDGGEPVLLFSDDFEDPESGWPEFFGADYAVSYGWGTYDIDLWGGDSWAFAYHGDVYDDFSAFVTAGPSFEDGQGYCGLIFRVEDVDHFYSFEVDTDGYWELYRRDGDDWEFLDDGEWDGSSQFASVGVTCIGNTFTLWIDDQEVGQVVDGAYPSGSLGFIAGSWEEGFSASFDDLEVWSTE
jgi:hypothetical protein